MGNYTSLCVFGQSSKKTAKLIIIDTQTGNLKKIDVPVKEAAEIMLEEPGHVISPFEEIRKTGRISAMKADDELLAGKVYMLVPVGKVHSKVSESELEVIVEVACSKKRSSSNRKRNGGAKVLPSATEEVREEGDSESMVFGGVDTGFSGYRLRTCRQWNPVLEPISELS
ncbi:DUF4228 domain-containing protein [Cephalotus follicularis]|uniref:DUF4228 domain-containing protein n=1 Tax=Cephalotus follicularis TaxID=3775 RepID=A0A1Q3CR11_CEPFO|nr:DUF4228 domain-containing protein [Cephalotus follicularis]